MYLYPADASEKLEFNKVKESIIDYCRNSNAKLIASKLKPFPTYEQALNACKQTHELLLSLLNGSYFPDVNAEECDKEISLLSVQGAVLSEKQILSVRLVIELGNNLIHYLKDKQEVYPHICLFISDLKENKACIDEIDRILDTTGQVKSSASQELGRIRKELNSKRREHDKIFQSIINKLRRAKLLSDTEETSIHGRRVLSLLSENKRALKGIVHGNSSTGKVTYLEPAETIEISNEIEILIGNERNEIRKILKELTSFLSIYKLEIKNIVSVLNILEFTRAKAYYARDIQATMPIFSAHTGLHLKNARHPLLVQQNKKSSKPVIPLSLNLNAKKSILIISGPNAGGKSIALKTVGLLQMMIQSGILIPADSNSEMGWFRNLLTDIGDSQSIEYELSTYSSRLRNMKHFLQRVGKQSLFLIDEFGTGSDPELGGAIAEVILEELAESRSFGIITTHYGNIKVAGENLKNVENASMMFNHQTLEPLYKLEIGKPGSSYTFVIAEKSGISKNLIERAKAKVSNDKIKLDEILSSLQSKKNQLNQSLAESKQLIENSKQAQKKWEEAKQNLEEKLEKINRNRAENQKLLDLGGKVKMILDEFNKTKDRKTLTAKIVRLAELEKTKKIEAQKRKKKTAKKEKVIEEKLIQITVGSKVRIVNGGKQTGVVEDIVKNKAKVTFGSIKSVISIENLIAVE
jgi:DNA mismatch repair protein MutS2